MKKVITIVLSVIMAFAMSSCVTSDPYGTGVNKKAGMGALMGAGAGYIAGDAMGGKTAEGMAIGAVTGLLAGFTKGKYDEQRIVYTARERELQAIAEQQAQEAREARERANTQQTKKNFTSTITYDKNGNILDRQTTETVTGSKVMDSYSLPY